MAGSRDVELACAFVSPDHATWWLFLANLRISCRLLILHRTVERQSVQPITKSHPIPPKISKTRGSISKATKFRYRALDAHQTVIGFVRTYLSPEHACTVPLFLDSEAMERVLRSEAIRSAVRVVVIVTCGSVAILTTV